MFSYVRDRSTHAVLESRSVRNRHSARSSPHDAYSLHVRSCMPRNTISRWLDIRWSSLLTRTTATEAPSIPPTTSRPRANSSWHELAQIVAFTPISNGSAVPLRPAPYPPASPHPCQLPASTAGLSFSRPSVIRRLYVKPSVASNDDHRAVRRRSRLKRDRRPAGGRERGLMRRQIGARQRLRREPP